MTRWRDILPVHPAADALPMLPPAELAELSADIMENGLRVPVVIVYDTGDPVLVDGRNRVDALELGGLTFSEPKGRTRAPLAWSGDWPAYADDADDRTPIRTGIVPFEEQDPDDVTAFVISANLRRRHLPPRELVRLALAIRHAGESAPDVVVSAGGRGITGEASEIARETGVPIRTVQRVLASGRVKVEPVDPAVTTEQLDAARVAAREAWQGAALLASRALASLDLIRANWTEGINVGRLHPGMTPDEYILTEIVAKLHGRAPIGNYRPEDVTVAHVEAWLRALVESDN